MKKAFTLIELLVVIAIIALLLAIVVPALHLAKRKGSLVVCMVNTKNLSLAWYMYKEDCDGRIMSAQMEGREPTGHYVGWTGTPRDASGTALSITQPSPPVTDADEIRGIERGRLHEYIKDPKAYHCPGDNIRRSKYDGTPVFLSYSVPTCLYAATDSSSTRYKQQIVKYSEITAPSQRYNFVEVAQTRNWNMSGWFSFGAPEWTGDIQRWGWWDPMAVNHGDASVMGYCDGHSESRKWQDSFTKERVNKLITQNVDTYNIEYPPAGQTEDIGFMVKGWAYRYRP